MEFNVVNETSILKAAMSPGSGSGPGRGSIGYLSRWDGTLGRHYQTG